MYIYAVDYQYYKGKDLSKLKLTGVSYDLFETKEKALVYAQKMINKKINEGFKKVGFSNAEVCVLRYEEPSDYVDGNPKFYEEFDLFISKKEVQ